MRIHSNKKPSSEAIRPRSKLSLRFSDKEIVQQLGGAVGALGRRRELLGRVVRRKDPEAASPDRCEVGHEGVGGQCTHQFAETRIWEVFGRASERMETRQSKRHLLSGTSVTAHPPPPAPVSFVLSVYGGAAVLERMDSRDGCDTPSFTR